MDTGGLLHSGSVVRRWLDDQTCRGRSSDGQMGDKLSRRLDGRVSSWKAKLSWASTSFIYLLFDRLKTLKLAGF